MSLRTAPFRIVAAILLAAAVLKALSPSALAAFLTFLGLGPDLARLGVLAIIAVESALGVGLLFQPSSARLRILASALASIFLVVPVARWLYPEAPGCGCLGSWTWADHPALSRPLWEFGRNLLLLGLLLLGASVPAPSLATTALDNPGDRQ